MPIQRAHAARANLIGTPMNRRGKFDAASFILAGESRNRTSKKKQNYKQ